MAYDTLFGFDLIQRKTLEKLLAQLDSEGWQDQIDALTARVVALEEAAEG